MLIYGRDDNDTTPTQITTFTRHNDYGNENE